MLTVGALLSACGGGAPPKAPAGPQGRVAFVSSRDDANPSCARMAPNECNTEIYIINADGSGVVRITNSPGRDEAPVWSPDGRMLAFIHVGTDTKPEPGEVVVVSPDGTGRRSLGPYSFIGGPGAALAWSPDSTKVAWAEHELAFHVANADGSGRDRFAKNLPTYGPAGWMGGEFWSPAGTRVAFASEGSFYLADANGARRNVLIRKLEDNEAIWAWSPDGTTIAYTQGSGTYLAKADGTGATRILNAPVTIGHEGEPGLTWSPDGTRLLLQRDGDLSIVTTDGSMRKLTTGPEFDVFPSWSSDGSGILFVRATLDSNGQELTGEALYTIKPDGSGLRLMTNSTRSGAWSPDSRWIAYESDDDIWIIKPDGSGKKNLTRSPGTDWGFAWSPVVR